MMAAVDQTGLVSLNRSRIWNVLARLPALSAASDAVMTEYRIPQYGISSKTLDPDAAADAGGRRLCVHVTARQHRPLSSSRRPRHPTTRPMGPPDARRQVLPGGRCSGGLVDRPPPHATQRLDRAFRAESWAMRNRGTPGSAPDTTCLYRHGEHSTLPRSGDLTVGLSP